MAIRIMADTHSILWYLYNDPRLSDTALQLMVSTEQAGDQIAISSLSLAEIVYLVEKGKIHNMAFERVLAALTQTNTTLVEVAFDRNIAITMRLIDRAQVPELPDRIVSATAHYLQVPVISRDRKISSSIVTTVW
jgi:PIN domain nuclease of toxin-antitoxin system